MVAKRVIFIENLLEEFYKQNLNKPITAGFRDEGVYVREKIESVLNTSKNVKILVSFKNIEPITHAFGDEVFGALIEKYGWNFVKENIKPIDANNTIKEILKTVVAFRFWKQKEREN